MSATAPLTRALAIASKVVLGLLAVLGVTVGLLSGAVRLGHLETFHIVSGSMSPAIEVSDLVISRPTPAHDVRVGDVVTVVEGDGYVTHRVIDIAPGNQDHSALLTLQGDANHSPDPAPYEVTDVPVMQLVIPKAGGLLDFLSTPPTPYFGLLILLAAMGFTFLPSKEDEEVAREEFDLPAGADAGGGPHTSRA